MSGVAWSGGSGNKIAKVEISTDKGKTWLPAELPPLPDVVTTSDNSRSWAWQQWNALIPRDSLAAGYALGALLTSRCTECAPVAMVVSSISAELCVKATDEFGNEQPSANHTAGGYLYNGWHRVTLNLTPDTKIVA